MSDSKNPVEAPAADGKELTSAMFMSLVMQQTNMASIFLGLRPNPQTGQTTREIEHAQYFIDQLEMLEVKTKGNLEKHEEGLLKNSLTSLRLAFVEAVSKPAESAPVAEPKVEAEKSTASPQPPAEETKPQATTETASEPAPSTEDSKKKFTKKY